METLITEAAKQVPALALMVIVVVAFLRHLATRDASAREHWKSIHTEHLDARKQSRDCIEKNTQALRDNAETRGQIKEVLEQLKDKL